MKILLIPCAVVLFATAASAENRVEIIQMGISNMQTTFQSGRNAASVAQIGTENNASISQNGDGNVAAIAQIGANHSRSVVQNGDRLGYASIQANNVLTGSFSRTGGNAFTSTTGQLDVVGPGAAQPESDEPESEQPESD